MFTAMGTMPVSLSADSAPSLPGMAYMAMTAPMSQRTRIRPATRRSNLPVLPKTRSCIDVLQMRLSNQQMAKNAIAKPPNESSTSGSHAHDPERWSMLVSPPNAILISSEAK